jgi:hypothetical protein
VSVCVKGEIRILTAGDDIGRFWQVPVADHLMTSKPSIYDAVLILQHACLYTSLIIGAGIAVGYF